MLRFLLVCCLLFSSLAANAQATTALEFERNLNQADITVDLFNHQPEVALGLQPLPWRWDTHFPRQRGLARFKLNFDLTALELRAAQENSEGLGLLAAQMGSRYRWQINGGDWRYVGWDELRTQYRSKPRWHFLPHDSLRVGPNTLVLELRMEPANDAGLSAIELKDLHASTQ